MHINLFCSWYSTFNIILSVGASYLLIIACEGFVFANSIDTICILDFIKIPDKSISAIARYLLSCDILTSATLDVTKLVLKTSFPVLSKTSTTDL